MKTATFKDFAETLPEAWKHQAGDPSNDDVLVYVDPVYKVWCREVRNVRVKEINGWLVPEPGQLIEYHQKINEG